MKERGADGWVLALVESFPRAGVLEAAQGWQPTERGTPQGGVISPPLANLYLNPLDHQMAAAGWERVRYADDFVILCRTQAEAQAALAAVRQWVSEVGLTLHPEKPRVVDARAPGGFDFLGHHFERGRRWPRKQSQANTIMAVDGYVRRRLRSLLQWRLDGVGKGSGATHQRWLNTWFARGGLLSLAAEHAWTRTIAKLCTH